MAPTAAEVWRDYVTDGVPSSGPHDPRKPDIRAWGGNIELLLNAGGLGGAVWKETKALLTADLAHAAGRVAAVYGDAVSANNGLYVKAGASGAGSWNQITTFLPGYQFVTATDDGDSTANAYTMDTNPRLPFGDGVALVEFVVPATNTSATVTVSFDGDAPLTIKTASGNSPTVGGLIEGMPVSGVKIGSNFFMRSDQASAALLTQVEEFVAEAEAAAEAAADYADFARNNWAVIGPFTGTGEEEDYLLSIDPGSPNNMFVIVGGVSQLTGSYALVYDGSDAFIRINVPEDVPFEVRVSNAIPVGAPSDGSVTTAKLANNGVSFAKLQDIETLRLLGRVAAGSGDPGEITAAQLRDLFFPAGSVIDSVIGTYAANTDISTVIPMDDSIPQIGEGVQIISVSLTPKSAANKLRIRYSGFGGVDGIAAWAHAVFNGSANAIHAGASTSSAAGHYNAFAGEVEYTPGVTTAQTISLRVGVTNSAQKLRLNGHPTTGRLFGGAAGVRLVVEEIKG